MSPPPEPTTSCLACGAESEVQEVGIVLEREGAPPGHPDHNIAYSHDVVVRCSECGATSLETWRHVCFDFEDWFDREWYFPIREEGASLDDAVATCPVPLSEACDCALHASLRASLEQLSPRDFGSDRSTGTQPPIRLVREQLGWSLRS